MLQTTLLPVLALPSLTGFAAAPPSTVDDLAARLPADAQAVLVLGDLTAATGEGAGSWGRVLVDPRWMEVFEAMVGESSDEEAAAVDGVAGLVGRLAEGVRGLAFGWTDLEAGEGVGYLSVADGWLEGLRAELAGQGAEVGELEVDGAPCLCLGQAPALYLLAAGPLVVAALGDGDEVVDELLPALRVRAAGAAPAEHRWWDDVGDRSPGALVEFILDGSVVPDLDPDAAEAFGPLGAVRFAVTLGDGHAADLALQVDFAGGAALARVEEVLAPADTALLALAPEGFTASVLGFDPDALVDALLDLAEEEVPGAREQFDAGLEAAAGVLGVELEEVLLGNLTGQLLVLQGPIDFQVIADMDPDLPPLDELMPVLALGLEDADLLLEAVEVLVETIESQGLALARTEVGGASLWSFDPGIGVSLGVAVGAGFLTLGEEPDVAAFLVGRTDADLPRELAPDALAALEEELEGAYVSAASMASVLDAMHGIVATLPELAALDGDEYDPALGEVMGLVTEILTDHVGGALGASLRIGATGMGMRLVCR